MKHQSYSALAQRYDRSRVGESIRNLGKQIVHGMASFPRSIPRFSGIDRVVVCAMGGSALGVDIVRHSFAPYIKVPITIVHGYELPAWVTKSTLIVAISYSGTTEEIISCVRRAQQKKLLLYVICVGGPLGRMIKQGVVPGFVFDPIYNPSKQPRIGTGYTLSALYMLLKKSHLLSPNVPDLEFIAKHIGTQRAKAASLAEKYAGLSFIIVGAEHLTGNAHVFANQMNECAKAFAAPFQLPELNHHLLEGMGSLKTARRHWVIVLLDSKTYSKKLQRRVVVTEKVFRAQGFKTVRVRVAGTNIEQAFRMMTLGAEWSYHAALLAHIDPSVIPWVDYFKKHL